jgi:hypothetical protein
MNAMLPQSPDACTGRQSPRCLVRVFLAAWALVAWGAVAAVAEPGADRHPELRRLSKTDDIWIDMPGKRVVVGGSVVLDKGPIEFFACPRGTKEHESIVAVRSSAKLVHAALLAIGLVPGRPVSFDPEYVVAEGPAVTVTMRWKDATGEHQEAVAQEWIRDTRSGERMKEHWVFGGSSFWKDPTDGTEHYQADGGDLICVSNFPTAMLDLPVESSQSNAALLFEVFEGKVPPNGTEVEMILSAAKPTAAPAAKPAAKPSAAP